MGGDIEISGVRRVEMDKNAGGDVELKNIAGDTEGEQVSEAVALTNIGGDLEVTDTPVYAYTVKSVVMSNSPKLGSPS